MAKATAICTCATCGATFERTRIERNRREADSWKDWAESHFDECSACYKKRLREEEAQKPLTITTSVYTITPALVFTASGNTMPRKDELKALGFRWQEPLPSGLLGFLSAKRPAKAWQKVFEIKHDDLDGFSDRLAKALEEIDSLGAEMVDSITDIDMEALRESLRIKEERQKAEADAIAALDKPTRPEFFPAGRWNGTIYGSARNGYSIYVNGEKITMDEAQKKTLEDYLAKAKAYSDAVDKIRRK